MQLVISPIKSRDDGEVIASLCRWLRRDSGVAQYGRVTIEAVGRPPGEMSGACDVINAVFADAGAAAGIGSLLVAFRSWRDTRTQAPAFRIEKDGVVVVVDKGSEEELQHILAVMLPDTGDAGAPGTVEGDLGAG